jgi:hypothetical protein
MGPSLILVERFQVRLGTRSRYLSTSDSPKLQLLFLSTGPQLDDLRVYFGRPVYVG